MAEQKPSLGRIVLYRGIVSNAANEHPALVTRVWSDTCVNLTVFPDYGSQELRTSVNQDEAMEQTQGWRWPPRV